VFLFVCSVAASGSATSSDSTTHSGLCLEHLDAGYLAQFDGHSNGVDVAASSGVAASAGAGAASTESPPVAPRTRVPLFPITTQGPTIFTEFYFYNFYFIFY